MEIWEIVCWSSKSNYKVYVEAEGAEQAKWKASDCIDEYNKTSEILDFVYYRESPEMVLGLSEGVSLNQLIPIERQRSNETFDSWLNS